MDEFPGRLWSRPGRGSVLTHRQRERLALLAPNLLDDIFSYGREGHAEFGEHDARRARVGLVLLATCRDERDQHVTRSNELRPEAERLEVSVLVDELEPLGVRAVNPASADAHTDAPQHCGLGGVERQPEAAHDALQYRVPVGALEHTEQQMLSPDVVVPQAMSLVVRQLDRPDTSVAVLNIKHFLTPKQETERTESPR